MPAGGTYHLELPRVSQTWLSYRRVAQLEPSPVSRFRRRDHWGSRLNREKPLQSPLLRGTVKSSGAR